MERSLEPASTVFEVLCVALLGLQLGLHRNKWVTRQMAAKKAVETPTVDVRVAHVE